MISLLKLVLLLLLLLPSRHVVTQVQMHALILMTDAIYITL
jgi:hypothetical protein